MFGFIQRWKKMRELQKLVNEAKKMGIVEPETTPDQLIDTLAETLKARMEVGSVVRPRRRKKNDSDDTEKVIRTRTKDIDAYMAQQMDMMINLFDKMFSLYERMDRKMGEIAKKYQKNVSTRVEKERKESFEDKLIEKIVEQYLLGGLAVPSGNVGSSSSTNGGGEVLKELLNIGNRKELIEKLEKVEEVEDHV